MMSIHIYCFYVYAARLTPGFPLFVYILKNSMIHKLCLFTFFGIVYRDVTVLFLDSIVCRCVRWVRCGVCFVERSRTCCERELTRCSTTLTSCSLELYCSRFSCFCCRPLHCTTSSSRRYVHVHVMYTFKYHSGSCTCRAPL